MKGAEKLSSFRYKDESTEQFAETYGRNRNCFSQRKAGHEYR